MNHFLLVEWVNENPKQFSVVPVSSIVDGTLRAQPHRLKNRLVQLKWKTKHFEGRILEIGEDEEALNHQADDFALTECEMGVSSPDISVRKNKRGRTPGCKKGQKSIEQSTQISDVLEQLQSAQHQSEEQEIIGVFTDRFVVEREQGRQLEASNDIDKVSTKISCEDVETAKCFKDKYYRLKKKFKALKHDYDELQEKSRKTSKSDLVELTPGSDVFLSQADLATIKSVSPTTTIFARNLFRRVFSVEELVGHSLLGKRCNANSTATISVLPEVDATRRNAVIGYTLKTFRKEDTMEDNVVMANKKQKIAEEKKEKRAITKSLSDFLREVNNRNRKQP